MAINGSYNPINQIVDKFRINRAEEKIKADGGTGAVDGKLSYEEVKDLHGDLFTKEQYDNVSKDGKDGDLLNARGYGELMNLATGQPVGQAGARLDESA